MQSKEQLLIVGCGDIGQRLAQCLPKEIYEVTGLRRNPPEDSAYVTYRSCDVTDEVQLTQALHGGSDIVMISMTPGERSDDGYRKAYVETCKNLIAILAKHQHKPKLLIFVSSSAVYAQVDASWVAEDSETLPESFSGKRLLEAEEIIKDSGFPNTIVRFSGIYGPNRNRLIDQVKQGKASASPHFTNRIHADDCARCLAHLIEMKRDGSQLEAVYLATDSAPAPMVEVVTWLAQQLDVTNFLSDEAINERGNKRCSNQRLLDSGFVFKHPTYKHGYAQVLANINK